MTKALQAILSHPLFHTTVTALVGFGVFVCIFPRYVPVFSWGINYAVPIMLGYLLAGLLFLLLKQPRLTFICFGAGGVLCLFLKFSVGDNSIERWRQTVVKPIVPRKVQEPAVVFKMAHLNVTNVGDATNLAETLRKSGADLISVHEVTPLWGRWLVDSLSEAYPFHHNYIDIGLFGMAIFSKNVLDGVDTFYYDEIPNIISHLQIGDQPISLISVHTEPALNESSLLRLREHLGVVAEKMKKEGPSLVFGNFNAVPWSGEIKTFRENSGLFESRTGFIQLASDGTSSFFNVPLDHIFYSHHLFALKFENLTTSEGNYLGVVGTYEFKPAPHYAE